MAGFIIRPKLTAKEATDLVDRARWFFANYPRRRVFRVGDESGRVWFTVRRAHILLDIQTHSADFACPVCGSHNTEATKEGLLFCYVCEITKRVNAHTEAQKHQDMLLAYAMDRGRQRQ